jgi:TolB-like protein
MRASGVGRRAFWPAIVAAACCTGCLYGFAGGGLPPHIRTVAILPFDNQTTDPQLTQQVSDAVREAFESRLGLRQAGEATADAVVRGAIVRYEPEIAVSFQAAQSTSGQQVNRRLVRISLNVEVFDQREGRTLWQRNGLTVDGEYSPGQETEGRQTALKKLVSDIVDGAQSQW